MNRTTKIILIVLAALLLAALLGWLGYSHYEQGQQLDAFADYQAVVENKGKQRFEQKAALLKEQLRKLAGEAGEALQQAERGQYFAQDPDALQERLRQIHSQLEEGYRKLDTAAYGGGFAEEDLLALEQQFIGQLEGMRHIAAEDSRLAKDRMRRYQQQLKAYRDSMALYLREKQALLDTLQALQTEMAGSRKRSRALQDERDRLLDMLQGKDRIIDSLSGDGTGYAQTIRALEDSLNLIEGRGLPAMARELRCYYVPKEKDKRGQVWLNQQPIHTPNKVREVNVSFELQVLAPNAESKVEVLLLLNRVPIRSLDVVAANGMATAAFDCAKEKLEPGNYELQLKYMGQVIRTHPFLISKPTLF
jgi:hypothetical protein